MMLSVSDDLADGRSEAPGSRRLARASGKEEAGAPSTARFDLVVPTPQGCHFSNTTGDYTPVVSCNRCFFQPSPMVLPLMVEMANQGHELLRAKIGKASRWGRPAFCKARFSNGPFGVKRFQTIRRCSVDVARGLVLLFGIGTRALPSWVSRTGWNNLWGGLAVLQTVGPSGFTSSPHPSSRKGHHSTTRWSSSVLLCCLIPHGFQAAVAACSRVHRNSVPSTQMRCRITASRRASATIAFFIPRCLAIFMAHALSHDHFVERTSMVWAAS
jgi:hypothetical protein